MPHPSTWARTNKHTQEAPQPASPNSGQPRPGEREPLLCLGVCQKACVCVCYYFFFHLAWTITSLIVKSASTTCKCRTKAGLDAEKHMSPASNWCVGQGVKGECYLVMVKVTVIMDVLRNISEPIYV